MRVTLFNMDSQRPQERNWRGEKTTWLFMESCWFQHLLSWKSSGGKKLGGKKQQLGNNVTNMICELSSCCRALTWKSLVLYDARRREVTFHQLSTQRRPTAHARGVANPMSHMHVLRLSQRPNYLHISIVTLKYQDKGKPQRHCELVDVGKILSARPRGYQLLFQDCFDTAGDL